MNEIQIFNNPEFGEISTVVIDGEAWFIGIELAKALGYAVPKTTVAKHVDGEDRKSTQIWYSGQMREMIVVNESGLYSLIFGSKLESAKKFKRWVTSEVLPQLRKTGSYSVPQTTDEKIRLLAQGNVELNQRVDAVSNEVDSLKSDFETFKRDLPVFSSDMRVIQTELKRKSVFYLGGKDSKAYKDNSIRGCVFADMQRELRRNFNVKRYDEIKHSQKKDALKVIESYTLPLFLEEQIAEMNG